MTRLSVWLSRALGAVPACVVLWWIDRAAARRDRARHDDRNRRWAA